jgi:hypothetical protein
MQVPLREPLPVSSVLQKLQCGLDGIERRVRLAANRLNRRQADDDNQGQHDCVFNSGGAVFGNDKLFDAGDE